MSNDYNYYGVCGRNFPLYQLEDKQKAFKNLMRYMFARTQHMFIYDGLPDTIPAREFEMMIQQNGFTGVAEHNNNLYAFYGSLGGVPDVYYRPTLFIVSNPVLKMSKEYKINDDVILVPNDSMFTGLYPMFARYCTQLIENDITLLMTDVNIRAMFSIICKNDNVKVAAEKYLKDLKDGKPGVFLDKVFQDCISVQPMTTSGAVNQISQLIEYQQYLKASMFNDIGLNSNYNMKREAINSDEAQMNNGALLPLVDDMLKSRETAIEKINEKFGLKISVKFNELWEKTKVEMTEPTQEEPEEKDGEQNDDETE